MLKKINTKFFEKKNKIILKKDKIYIKFSEELIKVKENSHKTSLNEAINKLIFTLRKECKEFDDAILLKNLRRAYFDLQNINKDNDDKIMGCVTFKERPKLKLASFSIADHELLHLSSTVTEDVDKRLIAAYEGYTELLSQRYFGIRKEKAYPTEIIIMKNIESIIGKNCFEKMYFKGQFFDKIFSELNKYQTKENIKILFDNMTEIYKLENNGLYKKEPSRFQELISETFYILCLCLKNKLSIYENDKEKLEIINQGVWFGNFNLGSEEFKFLNEESTINFLLNEFNNFRI